MATSLSTPSQLPSLRLRFDAWRNTRSRGQRIPEALWKAAVEAARVHGLCRTATALKLNYYDLQRRLWGHPLPLQRRAGKWSPVPAPAFVELASTALAGGDEHGALELVKPSGTRLILRFPRIPANELLDLVELFLRYDA
jgi:hypothetical protein